MCLPPDAGRETVGPGTASAFQLERAMAIIQGRFLSEVLEEVRKKGGDKVTMNP